MAVQLQFAFILSIHNSNNNTDVLEDSKHNNDNSESMTIDFNTNVSSDSYYSNNNNSSFTASLRALSISGLRIQVNNSDNNEDSGIRNAMHIYHDNNNDNNGHHTNRMSDTVNSHNNNFGFT
jgi:hypothetical protein